MTNPITPILSPDGTLGERPGPHFVASPDGIEAQPTTAEMARQMLRPPLVADGAILSDSDAILVGIASVLAFPERLAALAAIAAATRAQVSLAGERGAV